MQSDNSIGLRQFDNIKMNLVFFIYFAGMFCLYTITAVQLLLQVMIVAYVLIDKIKYQKLIIKKKAIVNVVMYFCWIGALTCLAYISQHWAYGIYPGSKTLITLLRSSIMGGMIVLYIDSNKRLYGVLKALIYATFILGVVVLVTTPISQYGKSGDEGFGLLIGQHRNQVGMISVFMAFICLFIKKNHGFKNGYSFALFFLILLLCTGSRGSMIQLLIIYAIYILTEENMSKRMKSIAIALFISIIGFILIISVPYLNSTIYQRFIGLFEVMVGSGTGDSSIYGRSLYRVRAFDMFLQRPILGYGVDGFISYFADNRIINGKSFGTIAYSHCNFTELAADFGILGLITWYWMIIYILLMSFKKRKCDSTFRMLLILIISMVVLDIARINWTTHMSIYLYTIVFCILRISLERYYILRKEEREYAKS